MNAFSNHVPSEVVAHAIRAFFSYVMIALLFAFCTLPSLAYADEAEKSDGASESSESSKGVSEEAAKEDAEESEEDVYLVALAHCIEGLFAGWGVSDSAGFYASDQLDAANGTYAWLAFDVYRSGLTDGSGTFVERLERYVTESYASKELGLDQRAPTTWARTAIIVNAFGKDPAAFGHDSKGKPANLLSDGIFNWAYTANLGDQGSNAWIYALEAVDAAKAKAPKGAKYTEADLIKHLLACQAKDGSFALIENSKTGSVDLTGMALSALGPHRDDPGVMQAIESAISYLSAQQAKDGSFKFEGGSSSESCSVVIMGLSACGIDVGSDERFIKGGKTLLDALLAFQRPDGTFKHLSDDADDGTMQDTPTEQAIRALIAYEELLHGGDGNVYGIDVSIDVKAVGAEASASEFMGLSPAWGMRLYSMALGIAVGIAFAVILWAIGKIRRKARR